MSRMATTAVRAQVAAERHEQAWRRDEMARHRDEVAAARDREAEEVDMAAEEMAGQLGKGSPPPRSAVARAIRHRAAEDRHRAARDREEAARDRQEAASDRELLMAEIERSHSRTSRPVPTAGDSGRCSCTMSSSAPKAWAARWRSESSHLGRPPRLSNVRTTRLLPPWLAISTSPCGGGSAPLTRLFAGARVSSSAPSRRSTLRRHGAGSLTRALKLPSATPKTQPASGCLLPWKETTTPSRAWSSGPSSCPRPSTRPFRRHLQADVTVGRFRFHAKAR